MNIRKYGTDYGSFWLPKDLDKYLNNESVFYSFGAGEDISFDCLVSGLIGCDVYIFDPTPRAIAHVNQVREVLTTKIKPEYDKKIGGGDPNYWNIILHSGCVPEKIKSFDFGIYTENTIVKFYKPTNSEYVSHSISPLNRSVDYLEVDVKTLKTIMELNGHREIDILKLDIENIECDIIDQMLNDKIFPKFLSVDFDYARSGKDGQIRTDNTVKNLYKNGYQLLHNDNLDVTFYRPEQI